MSIIFNGYDTEDSKVCNAFLRFIVDVEVAKIGAVNAEIKPLFEI